MIDNFLFADWDEAPEAMNFETPYGLAIEHCRELSAALAACRGKPGQAQFDQALRLFLLAPAIINVALNYRICVEFGLPLHPTEYIDFRHTAQHQLAYSEEQRSRAVDLFDASIKLARAAYRLDPEFGAMADNFLRQLPAGLESFVYTSRADKYTWRGADPAKVRALAEHVARRGQPELALGAAHGAIMAGLLLAEYLACPLWFLRFSMFKRQDAGPVITPSDRALLAKPYRPGGLLVFDEDSATGTTLSILSAEIRNIVPTIRTAAVIRHITTNFEPDHIGKTWWD